jgi:SAM-dependent methyltransferase
MPRIRPVEQFRAAEARLVQPWVRSGDRLLDIGAGTGYQARLFHDYGCMVTAIDVAVGPPEYQFWPVRRFDGLNLPYGDSSFDVVFTSNVLEHVADRKRLLAEIRRVLAPNGSAIHVVPSASWRFWTAVARWANKLIVCMHRAQSSAESQPTIPTGEIPTGCSRSPYVRASHPFEYVVLGPPHGEYPTTRSELVAYRRDEWMKVFADSGFSLVDAFGNRLFYTGYTLVKGLSPALRRFLSRLLGSSCHVFILRPSTAEPIGTDVDTH